MPYHNRKQPLADRVVLISGAGSGIGRALALRAAFLGADVILAGRRSEMLQTVYDDIEPIRRKRPDSKQKIACMVTDIRRQNDRTSLFREVMAMFGRIDFLVNNAGVLRVGPLSTLSNDDLEQMMETNVIAHIAMTRDALPLLQRSDQPWIVNVGSVFGDIAFPLFTAYSVTKFALRGFSDALRRELAPQKIGVTYIAPRAAKTEATTAFENLIETFSMTVDQPDVIAVAAWKGILKGKRSVYPKGPERFFVLIQRLAPQLVDGGIIRQFTGWLQKA